jgi:hypothetical protein
MLKADQPTSTIASGLNRRGILSGGCRTASPSSSIVVATRLFLEGGAKFLIPIAVRFSPAACAPLLPPPAASMRGQAFSSSRIQNGLERAAGAVLQRC